MLNNSVALAQHGFSSVQYGANGQALFNNGHIAIAKDLIFGLSVWTGDSWFPVSDCTTEEIITIKEAIASGNLKFPWYDELNAALAKAQ